MRVAEAIVQILEKEGISDAFGIPGAGINPVYKYLENSSIHHYVMRHEEAATHAADAYFRASHRIAAALCTSGPGATNFVTGLYTAAADSIPLLAITGQANTWQMKQEAFQCVDIALICASVAKKTWCVTEPTLAPAILREAFHAMRSGRPGPVVVDLPLNVQMAEIDFDIADYTPAGVIVSGPDMHLVDQALDLIAASRAPLVIMGGGVTLSESESDLIAFAELLQIPIIQTYMAKGGVPLGHPLNAGSMGIQVGQPLGNRVFLDSDLVLGVGCRFTDRHTGDIKTYTEGRKFIHIDVEPSQIGKVFEPTLGIVSDAGLAMKAMLARAKARGMQPVNLQRVEDLAALRAELERRTDYDDVPIKPHRVFREINEFFDDETFFTVGCGIVQIWSGQLQKIGKPMRYLPSGGAGTLGFDIPAAFGAKVANPDKTVVTVLGDFGFTFMVEEIAVAAAYKMPIIVVIVNNACLGLIRQNQKLAYEYEYAVKMACNQDGTIDYVRVAEGFGCQGERVFKPEDIRPALERACASGKTYVIDIVCDTNQLCSMGGSVAKIREFT